MCVCSSGYWRDTAADECVPCGNWAYKSDTGNMAACTSCSAHSSSASAVTGVPDGVQCSCLSGFEPLNVSAPSDQPPTCLCPAGMHLYLDVCVPCESAQYAPNPNTDASCLPCPDYAERTAAGTSCQCMNGFVERPSANAIGFVCECPAGTRLSVTSMPSCVPCDAGEYRASTGNERVCALCPAFRESSDANGTACLCSPTFFTVNASGTSECHCAAGSQPMHLTGGAVEGLWRCVECAPGYISPGGLSAVCTACPPGTHSSSDGHVCIPCARGYVQAQEAQTACTACTYTEISHNRNATGDAGGNGAFWPYSDTGGQTCLRCVAEDMFAHSRASSDLTMCVCDAPAYWGDTALAAQRMHDKELSLSERRVLAQQVCQPCPIGAYCAHPTFIQPQPGYWRSSANSVVFYQCPGGAAACLSGGVCADGHNGPLCSVCNDGYRTSGGTCVACPAPEAMAVLAVSFTIALVLLIAAAIALMSAASKRGIHLLNREASNRLKIVVGLVQVCSSRLNASLCGGARTRAHTHTHAHTRARARTFAHARARSRTPT